MKGLVCFIAGTTLGALGTLIYVKKRVIPEIKDDLRKELEEEQQAYETTTTADISKEYEPKVVDTGTVIIDTPNPSYAGAYNTHMVDYSTYSKGSDPAVNSTVTTQTIHINSSVAETAQDIQNNAEVKEEKNVEEPYLITAAEFEMYADYTSNSFVMYSDGIVLDEESEEILDEEPVNVFGKTALEELKKADVDLIYIRDDTRKKDYALERRDYPFDGPEGMNPGDDDWR